MSIHIGQPAPNFELLDQQGHPRKLSDYHGNWVILYFYPKDDTAGCTKEACAMRDTVPHFDNSQASVLGVSVDDVASHAKFAQKYRLNFPILADPDKKVVQSYEVWGQRSFMGKTYLGTARKTFIIDPQGLVAKIYDKVNPLAHAGQVAADLDQLRRIAPEAA